VALAKSGDETAMADLYERFEFFLLRFRTILKSGKFDANPSTRKFLALYVEVRPDNSGRQLRNALLARAARGPMNWRMMEMAKENIAMLREQLRPLDDTDIDSIIDVTFFQCVDVYDHKGKVRAELRKQNIDYDGLSDSSKRRYDTKRDEKGNLVYPEIGFQGFLSNYFHYLLRKNLDKEIRGVMPGLGWCDLWEDHTTPDFERSMNDPDHNDAQTVTHKAYSSIEDQYEKSVDIDHNWVAGATCQWPFSELNSQERWLIKARYYDKMFVCDIADILGISTSAIRNRIKTARDKLLKVGGEELQAWLEHEYVPTDTAHVRDWYSTNNKTLARLWGFIDDDLDIEVEDE
jgi:hypothetical protein